MGFQAVLLSLVKCKPRSEDVEYEGETSCFAKLDVLHHLESLVHYFGEVKIHLGDCKI